MPDDLPTLFLIENWRIDCNQNLAWEGNRKVRIEPKAMMILQFLAAQPGKIVTRETLFEQFWPNQVVTEDALNRVMSNLRRAFRDSSSHPKYIATVKKVGYKLVAPVSVLESPQLKSVPEPEQSDSAGSENTSPESLNTKFKYHYLIGFSLVSILILVFWLNRGDEPVKFPVNRFTYSESQNTSPSYSSDGRWLAYVGKRLDVPNQLIFRSLVDKFDLPVGRENLSYHYPAFSGDSQSLAVVTENVNDGKIAVTLVDMDSKEHQQQLVLDEISQGLAWHPSKKLLVYSQPHLEQSNSGLYLWHMDLKQQQLLTPSVLGASDSHPVFSPSGQQVAFQRKSAFKEKAVFVTDLVGNVQRVSTFNSEVYGFDWLDETRLLVSERDGIFEYTLSGEKQFWQGFTENTPSYDLRVNRGKQQLLLSRRQTQHESRVVDLTNSHAGAVVTRSQTNDIELAISKSGYHFAFVSDRTGKKRLWHRAGNRIDSVPNTEFDCIYDLTWSPNSEVLAAVVKNKNRYGVLYFEVKDRIANTHWLSSNPVNLVGWRSEREVVFTQQQVTGTRYYWRLHQLNIEGVKSEPLAKFDIYQARITRDKRQLVFINSSRKNLWIWDWHSQPQPIKGSQGFGLDRNWYVDNEAVYFLTNRPDQASSSLNQFKFDSDAKNSELIEVGRYSKFSKKYRPQDLVYGFTATRQRQIEGDFWLLDMVYENVKSESDD
ncbi:winged helix-turn-helix domain-containing protein [Aliikangiella coralliicola]|uniref:OmpR/PhoB-type domain-containing protein n=1 Tax=Aliikangiella coralliicola TaxID=2592383 RepID=A0A545UJ86_9GAMM|nr:winged helix-turn-helix domain-containing protein [Aliikangiella coralliicola]TQV89527.1 hypothetical protein FLL46_01190 [Aliikangiella coralliicola]